MDLILVRHTSVNVPTGMCYGEIDVPLAGSFNSEARIIQQNLRNDAFHAIYSSPLIRCAKLANKLKNEHTIQYDNDLKELNFGTWENKFWKDIEQTETAKYWFENFVYRKCPDGESYEDLQNRVKQFLELLFQKHKKDTVLIVSHGGPIRAIVASIKGLEPIKSFDLKVDYGQVIRIKY